VGLKVYCLVAIQPPCVSQQSHHCGIESDAGFLPANLVEKQQSHHCGIESCFIPEKILTTAGSNRTIVGLKASVFVDNGFGGAGQQSHHCGIESIFADFVHRWSKRGSNRTIVGLKGA